MQGQRGIWGSQAMDLSPAQGGIVEFTTRRGRALPDRHPRVQLRRTRRARPGPGRRRRPAELSRRMARPLALIRSGPSNLAAPAAPARAVEIGGRPRRRLTDDQARGRPVGPAIRPQRTAGRARRARSAIDVRSPAASRPSCSPWRPTPPRAWSSVATIWLPLHLRAGGRREHRDRGSRAVLHGRARRVAPGEPRLRIAAIVLVAGGAAGAGSGCRPAGSAVAGDWRRVLPRAASSPWRRPPSAAARDARVQAAARRTWPTAVALAQVGAGVALAGLMLAGWAAGSRRLGRAQAGARLAERLRLRGPGRGRLAGPPGTDGCRGQDPAASERRRSRSSA